MATPAEVAKAFSQHRFPEAYPSLAEGVEWVAIGGATARGRAAVTDVCEGTTSELAGTAVEFLRVLVIDGGGTVAVDTVTRYVDEAGEATQVASCDIYEFRDALITTITSYAVEVEPKG